MKLFASRPAPSPTAIRDVVAVALRLALGRWPSEFVKDSLAPRGAEERLHARLAKLRLTACCSEPLVAACALIDADPICAAANLRDRLVESMADALAGDPRHVPHRVRRLVEESWPRFFTIFADELCSGGHR